MHRFFLPQKFDKEIIFIKERALVHQMKRVLRLHKGDQVAFFNDRPEDLGFDVIAELKNIEGATAIFLMRERKEHFRENKKKLTLFCSLIKKEKFEWVLQKGTEVGVSDFVPIVAVRSEKKSINAPRCEIILKEAAEQSGRAVIPRLHPVISLEKALESTATGGQKTYFAYEGERENMIRGAGDRTINLFIGPEGGWDAKEVFMASRANCEIVSLGRLVLRAETAAVAGSYMLLCG